MPPGSGRKIRKSLWSAAREWAAGAGWGAQRGQELSQILLGLGTYSWSWWGEGRNEAHRAPRHPRSSQPALSSGFLGGSPFWSQERICGCTDTPPLTCLQGERFQVPTERFTFLMGDFFIC